MDQQTIFRSQAHNNSWSNYRLIGSCKRLSMDDLHQKRTSFFPSIIATLNHVLIVDWFYVSAMEGACMGYDAFKSEVPHPDIASLFGAQQKIDQRLIAVCNDSTLCHPDREISLIRGNETQVENFTRTFLHLIQHQIHHRGQVHAMLSGTTTAPPQLDEFFLQGETDTARRAPDFAQLGTSEAEIWG